MSGRVVRLAATLALAVAMIGSRLDGGAAAAAAGYEPEAAGPPAEVLALLPEHAQVIDARAADLRGLGDRSWVLLYDAARSPSYPEWEAAIVVPAGEGWALGRTLSVEAAVLAGVVLVEIDGVTAVALHAAIGAHGSALQIARWDGELFSLVFDGWSNTPNLAIADLDGDGVPEVVQGWSPYCEAYAVSPQLTAVYRWTELGFVDATAEFPEVVAADRAAVFAAETAAGDWSNRGRACLAGALGYLAFLEGDEEQAAWECGRARELDAEWREEWAAPFCP